MATKSVVPGLDLQMLDPALIIGDQNSRFSLKKARVDALAADILDKGGVMTPLEVEPLDPPVDGKTFRITAGHYRHAAVEKLNAEQKAGLLLPCIVNPIGDSVVRLKRQLAENMERENQSPMDQAIAIRALFDAGVSKMEIRKIFARPGRQKGGALQPASNSFINMTVSFLDLPKPIQTKIHNGQIGVENAYELTKVAPDKREAVLERAERDFNAKFEQDEEDERKFLELERKAAEAQAKADEAQKELDAAKADTEAALIAQQEKARVAQELYAAKQKRLDAAAKKLAEEKWKEANEAAQAAEKLVAEKRKLAEKIETKVQTVAEAAQARKAKLEAAAAPVATSKALKSGAIKKAAAAETESGPVSLSASEMRKVVAELQLAGSYEKVKAIAAAFESCFKGVITDKKLYNELGVITGERKGKGASA